MKSLIADLRWLFSPQDKKKLLGLSSLMTLSALLEITGVGLILGAAALFLSPDSAAGKNTNAILETVLPGVPGHGRIALLVALLTLLLIGKNIFALWIIRLQSRFIARKQSEIARRLFSTFIHADHEYSISLSKDEKFSGISRINYVCHQLLLPLMQMLADIAVVFIICVAVMILFPAVTLAGTLFMLLFAWGLSRLTGRINRRFGENFLQSEIAENSIRHAGITGGSAIKLAGAEAHFIRRHSAVYRQYAESFAKLYTLGQVPRLSLEAAAAVTASGAFIIMLLAGVPAGKIMIIFTVFTAAVARILPALSRCHYNLTLIRQYAPLLEKLLDSLKNIPQEHSNSRTPQPDAACGIKIEKLDFAYRNGTKVFENFSLEVPPGSITALAGASGRGKSTLAALIAGLLHPQRGSITAGNVPIENDLTAWRSQLACVPQDIFILNGSVQENVAFGIAPDQVDEAKISAALQAAKLADFAPDTVISAENLSGGQRQRLGIARAIYRNAKLLILDEPTSALDGVTEQEFCAMLDELRGKVTILLISHRETTLQHCDRTVRI